jgi:hypothetical protein
MGSLWDPTTGLIYAGSGQYYDPATGRFLTRQNQSGNPYLPAGVDPIGAMVGPLALVGLLAGKSKKKKAGLVIMVLIVLLATGVALAGCVPPPPPPPPPPTPPANGGGIGGNSGGSAGTPTPPPSPTPTPSIPTGTCAPTSGNPSGPQSTPGPGGSGSPSGGSGTPTPKNWEPVLYQITNYVVVLEGDTYFKSGDGNIPFYENSVNTYHRYNYAFVVGNSSTDYFWSVYVQGTGKTHDGKYIHTDLDPSHFPKTNIDGTPFTGHAVYQYVDAPKQKCSKPDLKEDETMAVSQDFLNGFSFSCGDQYYIEGHGDKIYTINDTGTFKGQHVFDIYAGEQTHDVFYSKYPDTGSFHRVAKVQK